MTDTMVDTMTPIPEPPNQQNTQAIPELVAIKAQLDDMKESFARMESHLVAKITALDDKILSERKERLESIAQERLERTKALEHERHERELAHNANADLIKAVDGKLDSFGLILSKISGLVESIPLIMASNQDMVKKFEIEIDRQAGRISDLTKQTNEIRQALSATSSQSAELHTAIYGGNDDRKSILAMIDETNTKQVESSKQITETLDRLSKLMAVNNSKVLQIDAQLAEDRARWDRRKKLIVEFGMKILGSRLTVLILAGLFTAALSLAIPEIAHYINLLVQAGG